MAEHQNGQVVRESRGDPPVTVVREFRVRTGCEGQFELLMGAIVDEARRQPGHLGTTVMRPRGPGDAYRFVYKFDRHSNLDAWHRSDLRASLFEPVREIIDLDRFDEYPGLETWFDLPSLPGPPKWKTTLLSWAAIYLLVMGVSYGLHALGLRDMPIPVRALVLSGIVVPVVAYFVAPWLGRRFHRWLNAGRRTTRSN